MLLTNGVTVHNGTYSYDGAGRLDQCIDSTTGLTEIYAWNADSTLASMPGPGYTREFTYNEEAQLLGISHSGTLAYQYAYGADGNRRWSHDIANDLWTWYPCGVACGAGEMVEETSDLTGSSWSTSGQYLRAGGGCSSLLIRRKSTTDDEYHHADLHNNHCVITNTVTNVIRNNIYDAFTTLIYNVSTSLSQHISVCFSEIAEISYLIKGDNRIYFPNRSLFISDMKKNIHNSFICTDNYVLECLKVCEKLGNSWSFCANLCIEQGSTRYKCTSKCALDGKAPHCREYIYGSGEGGTESLACKAAKKMLINKYLLVVVKGIVSHVNVLRHGTYKYICII